MKIFAAQVEEAKEGRDGKPSVGPVYRNLLSKNEFPPPARDLSTSWDIFRTSVQKNPGNQLGWRKNVDAKGNENTSEILPPQPINICTIMYTSGTSGDPKRVVLTHETVAAFVTGVDLFLDQFKDKMTADYVYLSFLPLAHILDCMIEEYFFRKGASVGYYHGDLNALRDDLMELKPTVLAGVPRVFEKIHEGIKKALEDLKPLRRRIFDNS